MEAFTQAAVRVANYVGNDNISVVITSLYSLVVGKAAVSLYRRRDIIY